MKTELQAVAPELAAWIGPMGPEALLRRLVELAPAYNIPPRGPGEWAAFFDVYLRTLAPLSAEAFDDAIIRWNRGEFFSKKEDKTWASVYPKANQIWELAQPMHLAFAKIAYRADKALRHVERLPPPRRDRMTKAEMIAAGFLNPDGSANLGSRTGIPPVTPEPRGESPQQMAARARAAVAEDEDDGESL